MDLCDLQSSGFDQNEISTNKNGGITDQTRAFPLQNLAFPNASRHGAKQQKKLGHQTLMMPGFYTKA